MNQFYNPVAVSFGAATAEAFADLFNKRYPDIKRVLLLTRGRALRRAIVYSL